MSRYGTPLRYPGGKQKLAPFFLELLDANGLLGGDYVEPYAGGAGVAIQLLLGRHAARIHLNDSSYPVYAFWRAVVNFPDQMCRRIASASLTVEQWKKHREVVRDCSSHDELEVGFSTLYLNRCNRSGVLSGGLIGGLEQTGQWGIASRFPRNELIRRIEAIALHRESIHLRNWDAERFILKYAANLPLRTLVYCDPPYFGQSSRLYLDRYTRDDHARLASIIQTSLPRKWVVSYDSAPAVVELYESRRSFRYALQYNASRAYKGHEVLFFSDDLAIPRGSVVPFIDEALGSALSALHV